MSEVVEIYKENARKVYKNEKWQKLLNKLELDEEERKTFTALAVLAYNYRDGDALAGMLLDALSSVDKVRNLMKKFGEKHINRTRIFGVFYDLNCKLDFKLFRTIKEIIG